MDISVFGSGLRMCVPYCDPGAVPSSPCEVLGEDQGLLRADQEDSSEIPGCSAASGDNVGKRFCAVLTGCWGAPRRAMCGEP